MKLVWVVVVFASVFAAVGAACGPQEPYCYDEHKTCAQAKIDRDQAELSRRADQAAAKADAGTPSDAGATIIGN